MDKNKKIAHTPKQHSRKTASHILVIRLSALGDVAMMVPVLRTFSRYYPHVRLTIVSRRFFKPLFAGIHNLNFYEADVYGKHKGILGLWRLAKALKKLKIDAVADLHHVLRSNILKLFFRIKGIPVIQIDKGRKEKRALVRKTHKTFIPLKTTHQRYADVFSALGFPIDFSRHQFPLKEELPKKITKVVGIKDKKWIGIAPFAAYKGKMYPLHLMNNVIETLDNTQKYIILLFGGGKEEANLLKTMAQNHNHVIPTAGRFSFEEELCLISHLDLMLAMDSGNAHLAAMYGVATLTLWGVTHPFAGFYPFGQPADYALLADREKYPLLPTSVYGNSYPKDYEDVMQSILPEQVVAKIYEILM